MTIDVEKILRRQSDLESRRANFDSHWQDVQDFILPQSVGFVSQGAAGVKVLDRVFDPTPIAACEHFAAATQSLIVPAHEQYQKLVTTDKDLMDDYDVADWCDDTTERMFRARYAPRAQFPQAVGEGFLAYGAFGNAVVNIEDARGEHMIYRTGHPREFYFTENHYGVIDTMHRKYQLRAEAAVACFKERGDQPLPREILTAAEKAPDTLFDFIQVVTPRGEIGYEKHDAPPMHRFASCTVSVTGRAMVRKRGYRTFPYAIARYATTSGETYGRGPGMTALPHVKTLNEMVKTLLRSGQKAVDPPVMLADEGALQAFQLRPGALNRSAVTADGKPLVLPFITGAKLEFGLEFVQDLRSQIYSIFKVDLFRILVDKPGDITATEALIRAQEKGALLAPIGQRAQADFVGAITRRELDILEAAGALRPMPPALRAAGGAAALKIEHASPLQIAQKQQKGHAIQVFLEQATALGAAMAADPNLSDIIDDGEVLRELRDISGAPQKIVRRPEETAARRAQKAQTADAAVALAAAEQSGKAAKDWSTAQAQAAQAPSSPLMPSP